MKKIRRLKNKLVLHPVLTIIILIFLTILISGILTLFNTSAYYNMISSSGTYIKKLVTVENLFSLSGLKYIFSNTVSNFVAFAPLSMLIITLIGFGVMDKSGFLDSLFYVFTKKASKRAVTFGLSLICILATIAGDLSFIVLIPLAAVLFKYGKRHPKAGIICAFASLGAGIGINLFTSSIESTMLGYTLKNAQILIPEYIISSNFSILFMFILSIIFALIITTVTEKNIVPSLGHYELLEEKEDYLTKSEKKGLVIALFSGIIYLLIFIYNIIPNAPLGGNLLDYSQTLYIDKLFGFDSFFNHGFVFVITLLFFILGLTYGLTSKSIKSIKDLGDTMSFSLDGIGKVLVLIFFASTFIFIYKQTNIGNVITAAFASLINNSGFVGIPLIIITLLISSICTLFLPATISKWAIMSGSVVPTFMNAGMSPEFASVVFRLGECITYALTPLMAYFIIYLAFMELYSVNDHKGLFGNLKYMLPYAFYILIIAIIALITFYIINIPLGLGAFPIL